MSDLLTMQQVAERIGVPLTTLKNWVYLPTAGFSFPRPTVVVAKQRAGRKGYWRTADVDAWRANHG